MLAAVQSLQRVLLLLEVKKMLENVVPCVPGWPDGINAVLESPSLVPLLPPHNIYLDVCGG